jgi:hypothetical protein
VRAAALALVLLVGCVALRSSEAPGPDASVDLVVPLDAPGELAPGLDVAPDRPDTGPDLVVPLDAPGELTPGLDVAPDRPDTGPDLVVALDVSAELGAPLDAGPDLVVALDVPAELGASSCELAPSLDESALPWSLAGTTCDAPAQPCGTSSPLRYYVRRFVLRAPLTATVTGPPGTQLWARATQFDGGWSQTHVCLDGGWTMVVGGGPVCLGVVRAGPDCGPFTLTLHR